MKNLHLKIFFALMMLLTGAFAANGRQIKSYPDVEKVTVFTDRSIYITGEKVQFSAFIRSAFQQEPPLSLILYVEIVTTDGKSIVREKFPVKNYFAEGSLSVPKDIITGIYYLRAYTKYMRNSGPEAYSYLALKIVNPLRNDIIQGSDTAGIAKAEANHADYADTFVISSDKNEYKPREVVHVSIIAQDIRPGDIQGLCISVVPEASYSENMLQLPVRDSQVKSLRYYPENRGVSLTGELKENASGNTIAGARVNLSIIGKGREFMAMQTDSSGRYFFTLPAYTGRRDLFLSAVNSLDSHPEIIVDNDFCTEPVHLPSPIFKLSADEYAATYKMALNARLWEIFAPDTIPCKDQVEISDRAFYGKPSATLIIDKYIQLPTLEDYFFELPTFVKVRKRHGEKYLKVIGSQAEMTFFDPLIMVDWVAIDDPAKILAIQPQDVERIEFVYEPYVKGDVTYGGIVSIISKRGDFAGIDLPASGKFINYRFLAEESTCRKSEPAIANIPEVRNTLFWEPNLELNAIDGAGITFTTPDTPGRYLILLNGVTRDGYNVTYKKEFDVSQEK
jgi:hypothetical protein